MSPESNGEWSEYRRMILDWHQQEVEERQEIKEKLESYQEATTLKLDTISNQLTALSVEKKFAKWVLSIGIPAAVTIVLTYVLRRVFP